jgi:hypothetical protein
MFMGMMARVLLGCRRRFMLAIVPNRSVCPLQWEDAQDEKGDKATHET